MRIDLHVHTSPGSRCSVMDVDSCIEAAAAMDLAVICVTNHGNMSDYYEMIKKMPPGMTVIGGVEISAADGDFLVFSTDRDFLDSLKPAQALPEPGDRPRGTAVVWAHPFAGSPGGRGMGEDYLSATASKVDGIEIFNGNWPDEAASSLARRIASKHNLAETGGSDAHRREHLGRCWTEAPAVKRVEDLVAAIKAGRTSAGKE